MAAFSGVGAVGSQEEDIRYWWCELEQGYYFPGRFPERCEWRRHGWYHVHDDSLRATCRVCSRHWGRYFSYPPRRALSFCAFESVASHFPPEVVHRIVELCPEAEAANTRDFRPWGPGMACRRWANLCLRRPMPSYHGDKLKGRERVMTLKALVSAPGSYLKHNVTKFTDITYYLDRNSGSTSTDGMPAQSNQDPWLHLLPATRRLLLNYRQEDNVEIRGPLSKGVRTMRSIHAYLPRPVPSSFSHDIKHLTLVHIQFRQLADLQHVLDELPSLCRFEGYDLSWPLVGAVQMTRVPHHKRGGSMSKYVSLKNCTSDLEAITLFASLHDERTWATPLRTLALSLGTSLSPGYRMTVEMREEYRAYLQNFHDHTFHVDAAHTACKHFYAFSFLELTALQDRIAKTKIGIRNKRKGPFTQFVIFACIPLATSLPPSDPRLHLEPAIYLAFTYSQDQFNWKTFDETFLHMTQLLGTCGVRVRRFNRTHSSEKSWRPLTDSKDDQGWRYIKKHLPLLFQAGKIEVPDNDPCNSESSGSDDEDQESEGEESDPLHHVEPVVLGS